MDNVELNIDPQEPQEPGKKSRYRPAVIVSVVFHVVLLVALFFWYLPRRSSQVADRNLAPTPAAPAPPSPDPPEPPPPPSSPEIPPERIENSIESHYRKFEKMSDEDKLSELEKNLKRLESISNEDSVREVTSTIADALGLEPGAVPDENAPEGDFDFDTAQLHDVTRSRNDEGAWEYQSVLVDSEGRTQTVPMTASEGEPVYQAFEQMNKFPMAAGIYRSVVMPLIQKSIQASELAEKAAREAERLRSQDESNLGVTQETEQAAQQGVSGDGG